MDEWKTCTLSPETGTVLTIECYQAHRDYYVVIIFKGITTRLDRMLAWLKIRWTLRGQGNKEMTHRKIGFTWARQRMNEDIMLTYTPTSKQSPLSF
jgi:hypothetical protein